jgi:hypothetical protein
VGGTSQSSLSSQMSHHHIVSSSHYLIFSSSHHSSSLSMCVFFHRVSSPVCPVVARLVVPYVRLVSSSRSSPHHLIISSSHHLIISSSHHLIISSSHHSSPPVCRVWSCLSRRVSSVPPSPVSSSRLAVSSQKTVWINTTHAHQNLREEPTHS